MEKRLDNHEAKLENLKEAIHSHDLKVQSLEHTIQTMGEARADQTYRRSPDGTDA